MAVVSEYLVELPTKFQFIYLVEFRGQKGNLLVGTQCPS